MKSDSKDNRLPETSKLVREQEIKRGIPAPFAKGAGVRGTRATVVEMDVATAWGRGLDACWRGICVGDSAFSPVSRFDVSRFACHQAALAPGLDPQAPDSLVWQMLEPMLDALADRIPADTLLLLATTTGEIDLLEKALACGQGLPEDSCLDRLAGRIATRLRLHAPGFVISSACASSTIAVADAASRIREGTHDSVLVVSCDTVTEFVFAGFSSLLALDPDGARPFDRSRKGLTLGDGAGYAWLMSDARAEREQRPSQGIVAGWGVSCDANHMTGPARDGAGLSRAIGQALRCATADPAVVDSICAHGTGTSYNDTMEMKAFRHALGDRPVPTYSVKGSIGHTLGAAGLIELAVSLRSIREETVPASAGLREPDADAAGWTSPAPVSRPGLSTVLSTNSGFGGVNAALLLART
jgi:3-oxoacyl-[acyl-carrier-protein] synthase II